ncbi:MAG: hypothetical protein GY781_04155 [Gammaproteobacteria bacterium]|nr:hypothetical protein [Gammaproteobacteria bacterium]
MAGACDSILSAEVQREHMQTFQNAKLVVIENAGHDILQNNSQRHLYPFGPIYESH